MNGKRNPLKVKCKKCKTKYWIDDNGNLDINCVSCQGDLIPFMVTAEDYREQEYLREEYIKTTTEESKPINCLELNHLILLVSDCKTAQKGFKDNLLKKLRKLEADILEPTQST